MSLPLHLAQPLTADQATCWLQRLKHKCRTRIAVLPSLTLGPVARKKASERLDSLERHAGVLQRLPCDIWLFCPDDVVRTVVAIITAADHQRALLHRAGTPRFILDGRELASMIAYLERVVARLRSDTEWVQSSKGQRLQQAAREIFREIGESRAACATKVCAGFGQEDLAVLPGSHHWEGEAEEGEIREHEDLPAPLSEFLLRLHGFPCAASSSSVALEALREYGSSASSTESASSTPPDSPSPSRHRPVALGNAALPPPTTARGISPRPARTPQILQQNTPPPDERSASSTYSSSSSSPSSSSEHLSPPVVPYPTPAHSLASLPPMASSSSSSSAQARAGSDARTPPALPRTPKRRRSAEEVQTPQAPRKRPRTSIHVRFWGILSDHEETLRSVEPFVGRAVPIPQSGGSSKIGGLHMDARAFDAGMSGRSWSSSAEYAFSSTTQQDRRYSSSSRSSGSSSSSDTLQTWSYVSEDEDPYDAGDEMDMSSFETEDDGSWQEYIVHDPANARDEPMVEDTRELSPDVGSNPPPPALSSKAAGKRRCWDGVMPSIRNLFAIR
ncbi:hypothetical protein BV20DRAFT_1049747 [Pilatotrama ljubarskyi]|nr:hypothetical protein BV20DRAFT_1049747 [Pilatotrama ljubarskyi]